MPDRPSAAPMRLVVFTDLDGTLLDHETYSWTPAEPALAELKRRGVPLVLASSKTAAEIAPLHQALNIGDAPAIVENGAGLHEPGRADAADDAEYRAIRAALADLPADLARRFRGFGDMDAAELAQSTGLAEDAATRARQRRFSEPGQWLGGEDELARFLDILEARGITARHGGRFLTLSHGRTKADAMLDLARRFKARVTIALGDAPNDAEMLETANIAVIVRNDHSLPMPPLAEDAERRILRTDEPGPEGWNKAVLGLLKEIGRG